ncbi:MAG: hypothetical protein ACI8UO_006060 [Verrucomicrobiales bacterium]|jgi:hypothetical protein
MRLCLFLLLCVQGLFAGEVINPYSRAVLGQQLLERWEFDAGAENWILENDLELDPEPVGWLSMRSTGVDPILTSPPIQIDPQAVIRLRMKSDSPGPGQVFWIGQDHAGPSEDFRSEFTVEADGTWREYAIECPFDFPLRQFRLDPGTAEGSIEIDWIRVEQRRLHPLEIKSLSVGETVLATVQNHSEGPIVAQVNGRPDAEIPPGKSEFEFPRITGTGLLTQEVRIESPGLPSVLRTTTIRGETTNSDRIVQRDGSAVFFGDSVMLGPLAARDGKPILFELVSQVNQKYVFVSEAEDARLSLEIDGNEIRYAMRSRDELEGPVVRIRGKIEQGMLAGVEHLGKDEKSSSTLDLRGPEHIRFAPDPLHVTMPFAGFVTDQASVAMSWRDPAATQPIFATPNFFEGTVDHRMALRGRDIRATIRIGDGWTKPTSLSDSPGHLIVPGDRLPDLIHWAIQEQGGLPARPEPPRTFDQQMEFCLGGFRESAIVAEDAGWFHAVIPGGRTSPDKPRIFADHLSTIYRISGELPEQPEIVFGGGHIENGTVYFLTSQAQQWLTIQKNRAANLIKSQEPDGSWRYGGEFREGHFEDTSSGHCARSAQQLLSFAKATGDAEALEAGLRALKFIERFRTPRGAQFWECPLHAPDLLASAYLVKAFTIGYELTGNQHFRDQAISWALSGVPYVYLWSDRSVMGYATIATLCATNWQAPVWIGRPVQWCGLVYADALLDLAKHDDTIDWPKLAEGILISGEQQMYTEGRSVGLLADSLTLENQQLHPFDINPATIADLRMRIENGQLAGLSIARNDAHAVVSPVPVRIEGSRAIFDAPDGVDFQILIDGERIIEIKAGSPKLIDLETTR